MGGEGGIGPAWTPASSPGSASPSGVAMARRLEPDIVVIDLRVPVLNGLDATRLIRDGRPATQVVVLSAFESPELERQAREAGAFTRLDKGTTVRRVHRILLGAAVQAVRAASTRSV